VRAAAVERLCGHVELAAQLGAAVILGGIRGQLEGRPREAAVDAVRACARAATARGVELLLEPINRYETDFVNSVDEGLALVEEVGEPSLGILADTFHMNIEEARLGDAIVRAGERLRYVHVVDSNRHAPGRGHVDFGEVLDALGRIGYEGPLVAEVLPRPDDAAAAADSASFLVQASRSL